MRSEAEGAVPEDEETVTPGEDTAAEDEPKRKKPGSFWKELPVLIVVAIVLALVIKAFAVQAFYIPSGSMENTLQVGDRVLVNKIVYHTRSIEPGDIVVFNGLDSWDPETTVPKPSNPVSKVLHAIGTAFGVAPNEKDYIKRVIGVAGDRVKCCTAGRVTVNGKPLTEESYLYTDPVTHEQNRPSETAFDVTVPKGHIWVMGDHRDLSWDSRNHRGDPGGGAIPVDKVIGRAFVIVWPVGHMGGLGIPSTFEQPGIRASATVLPGTPLAAGFVGAVPVTLLWRRLRVRRNQRS
ncbi:Signal peptidase I [Actinomadura rubteroloni]|uniref:Signal peptidase I n=1 Tax=Actinomadura rubteroloni TaxID=1926885 RepID=A0A2P4UHK5_9ACTN|nr:signal peptidase I [Actinomadura rubteroloni]POM24539.1 Signal peptidase I [Actinomadura rubteroloni]